MLASAVVLEQASRVALDGDGALVQVRGFLCDFSVICVCHREHVGPPSKTDKGADKKLAARSG